MKHLMPNLISHNQGAFVPGRKSGDNVIVAQEIVRGFKNKKKASKMVG